MIPFSVTPILVQRRPPTKEIKSAGILAFGLAALMLAFQFNQLKLGDAFRRNHTPPLKVMSSPAHRRPAKTVSSPKKSPPAAAVKEKEDPLAKKLPAIRRELLEAEQMASTEALSEDSTLGPAFYSIVRKRHQFYREAIRQKYELSEEQFTKIYQQLAESLPPTRKPQ